ncbi:MAG: acetyl-CoA C-acetyltransferase [Mycobacteriaceae bacterium]
MSGSSGAPQAFIYDAVRTPRGKGRNGALHGVKPVTLTAGLLTALAERNDLDTSRVDDVVLGCVSPVDEQGADIARTAVMVAGWDESVAGMQLNRFCASGLEAVNLAAAKVGAGFEDLVVAGGVESMSRVPMGSDGGAWATDPETNLKTGFVPQGIGADLIATLEGFSRHDIDTFAATSHLRAAAAWEAGHFDRTVVAVRDRTGTLLLERDETVRPGTTAEVLGKLRSAFADQGAIGFDSVAIDHYPEVERINHIHTGGNSSGIVDGASAILIGNEQAGRDLGLTPRARIISTAIIGSEPTIMLTGPAPAARKALKRVGLTPEDIDLYEINEAFASVVLKFQRDLDLDPEKVNVLGGAIAMGHPLGATGAMILMTLADELERRQLRYGLATLCVGGGMGIATIIERV